MSLRRKKNPKKNKENSTGVAIRRKNIRMWRETMPNFFLCRSRIDNFISIGNQLKVSWENSPVNENINLKSAISLLFAHFPKQDQEIVFYAFGIIASSNILLCKFKAEDAMTSKERFTRMFEHREADRVPIIDIPWAGTLARWKREGMPDHADWRDFFGVDKLEMIQVDISPRYERKIIEENDEYVISTSEWGITLKNFKVPDSTPEFLEYKVNTREKWEDAKARMTVEKDRIDWKFLEENYPRWKAEGRWIEALWWFGFDSTHSWMAGTETILIAMLEEPEWVADMFNTYLDRTITLYDMLWDAGYRFDSIFWYDDMGYKNKTFFSNGLYQELLQPVHKRAIDWAHNHGIKAHLHSCGYIMPRIPQLVEIGLDALNPIEIKAGMDLAALKRDYGGKLVFHGGADALLLDKPEKIVPYIERILPIVKKDGGYIFSSDHSIPNTVSLDTYRKVVEAVKQFGSY
jgi:uroporphyrinogen decarboxylase